MLPRNSGAYHFHPTPAFPQQLYHPISSIPDFSILKAKLYQNISTVKNYRTFRENYSIVIGQYIIRHYSPHFPIFAYPTVFLTSLASNSNKNISTF